MESSLSNISSLPREIFWMVLGYLGHRDIIRSRRVCHAWNNAFRDSANMQFLLQKWFPLSDEAREPVMHRWGEDPASNEDDDDDNNNIDSDDDYWRKKFDHVVCRHDHLSCGKPKSVQKHKLCDDFGPTGEREWFPVPPWDNHASHLMQRVDRNFMETFWTYEDGLVVYPSADHHYLVLLDLDSDRKFMVPFMITEKVVRRVRLQQKVLVVEWAEPMAFHWLNDSDGVHRHFASSFDVERNSSNGGWSVTPRNEWKIMFLGHPLSDNDRFFSAHSKTHYVIYIWQPNRSLYTADEDAPIESLMAWDISAPSLYRPSLDVTGSKERGNNHTNNDTGPSIVARFGFRELGFFSVRQRGLPAIQRLAITDDANAIEITEHRCTGPMDRLVGPAEWTSQVYLTSIPLIGEGPVLRKPLPDVSMSPYRGNSDGLQSTPLVSSSERLWYTVVSEAVDEKTHVAYRLDLSPLNWPFDLRAFLSIEIPTYGIETTLKHVDIFELAGRGKICGNENHLVGENNNRELIIWRFDR